MHLFNLILISKEYFIKFFEKFKQLRAHMDEFRCLKTFSCNFNLLHLNLIIQDPKNLLSSVDPPLCMLLIFYFFLLKFDFLMA